ncbi:MAG: hypothetical protein PWQ27_1315 [Kosmotoga sp.]|nr:hypothetical protein [Kosmotoga sp.]MDK2953932.1 hypothetical protein [Kosmotoga sp.]
MRRIGGSNMRKTWCLVSIAMIFLLITACMNMAPTEATVKRDAKTEAVKSPGMPTAYSTSEFVRTRIVVWHYDVFVQTSYDDHTISRKFFSVEMEPHIKRVYFQPENFSDGERRMLEITKQSVKLINLDKHKMEDLPESLKDIEKNLPDRWLLEMREFLKQNNYQLVKSKEGISVYECFNKENNIYEKVVIDDKLNLPKSMEIRRGKDIFTNVTFLFEDRSGVYIPKQININWHSHGVVLRNTMKIVTKRLKVMKK